MSILTGPEIVRVVERTKYHNECAYFKDNPPILPRITIEPFNPTHAGPNSYDVHLSNQLRVYRIKSVAAKYPALFFPTFDPLDRMRAYEKLPDAVDARNPPDTMDMEITEAGFTLLPGVLYLGATVERTHCEGLVPWIDGRSSLGRLGLTLHITAGRGDDGWAGRWTLEIVAVAHPVTVYPNMRCGQLTFFHLSGERKPYTGRYQNQDMPTGSKMHLETPDPRQDAKLDRL